MTPTPSLRYVLALELVDKRTRDIKLDHVLRKGRHSRSSSPLGSCGFFHDHLFGLNGGWL